ncbi:hypothetical protein H0H81_001818 [Sphagnurus paluster]|uniref:Uncharacterized protein n=1 Tax=Sphagnurus paluster TaxID=117069 RepID=A0A9P7KLW8_9AGAR|nr:hypothetical protein H0H81_001818 [Sphagnurus paluster]
MVKIEAWIAKERAAREGLGPGLGGTLCEGRLDPLYYRVCHVLATVVGRTEIGRTLRPANPRPRPVHRHLKLPARLRLSLIISPFGMGPLFFIGGGAILKTPARRRRGRQTPARQQAAVGVCVRHLPDPHKALRARTPLRVGVAVVLEYTSVVVED